MQFNRLRLVGFKSFVEPTDLAVAPGLTGIVGPNGCGKSNLVEALRWVMGETSARQMRGGEMDDVIFGGTTTRPARNLAEVVLAIDNSDRRAPAQFNDHEELEIVRRIHRGEGSSYRVNGREVRARDVQLLFADAATGAHSPALVSQGRIGALIAARPGDRRAILEDAAGIAGLHARRHEAELRLKAAEANLTRLDDVLMALDGQAKALQRQARQAQRYRNLGEQIRKTEAVVLAAAWAHAIAARTQAGEGLLSAEAVVAQRVGEAATAARIQAEREADLPPLRAAEAAAAATLQRLTLALGELEAEGKRVADRRRVLAQTTEQILRDVERERSLEGDAAAALARLGEEEAALARQEAVEAPRRVGLTERVDAAKRAMDQADAAVQDLTRAVAGEEVRRQDLERRRQEATSRVQRLERERAAAVDRLRLAEADPALAFDAAAADQAIEAAESAAATARAALDRLAAERTEAAAADAEAVRTVQALEGEIGRRQAEAKGIAALLTPAAGKAGPPVLDRIAVSPGYEAALAAALGEDALIPLAVTGAELVRWGLHAGAETASLPGAGPQAAEPLALHVEVPPALRARVSQVWVVADADLLTAAAQLQPGQRVVTRAGDLARWDGFVRRADAPAAAQAEAAQRLARRNRLAALDAELADLTTRRREAVAVLEAARATRQRLDAADQTARHADRQAAQAVLTARDARTRATAAVAAAEARATAARTALDRVDADVSEAQTVATAVHQEIAALPDLAERRAAVLTARTVLAEARSTLAEARGDQDRLIRDQAARLRRGEAIRAERLTWDNRRGGAAARLEDLATRRQEAEAEAALLAERPAALEQERQTLAGAIETATSQRRAAADQLAHAETARTEADRAARRADAAAADAREARVRAEAAVDAAKREAEAVAHRIAERLGCRPDQVAAVAEIDPADPPDEDAARQRLERLVRERDAMGPVNLRADAELTELEQQIGALTAEKDDLQQAIARLRGAISQISREGRERLMAAFELVNGHFERLFTRLFGGGRALLELTNTEDPFAAGLEIMASPPGKKLQTLSLLSGGEQALTALSLIFAVFLTNPSPICVLDEVDAPLDDANVDRFCTLLSEIAEATGTRFLVVTHHRLTMARMDRLFGVTMMERGVSQLVSVDLRRAEALVDG
ncbi:MAG: chromosome segregation protein SMC [Alphaproteobacteria bacterium]|nr:chromosome segregation protein SMC [Alphaproteobacteria bacterium]